MTAATNTTCNWLAAYRDKHAALFAIQGLPDKRHEQWKYADLTFLSGESFAPSATVPAQMTKPDSHDDSIQLVFVNGIFSAELSDLSRLPTDIIACSLQQAFLLHADKLAALWQGFTHDAHDAFAQLNAAHFNDGLFLEVPDDCIVKQPLRLVFISASDIQINTHTRLLIKLGKNSQLTLIEDYRAQASPRYINNISMAMNIAANGKLQYIKLQQENTHAVHIANTNILQHKDSQVSLVYLGRGAQFARDNINVTLSESGAECKAAGFYHLKQDGQYIDYHLTVEHAAPHTTSEMTFKGIADKKSRAVFNGRLHVQPHAQKIIAHQANHNILLSREAEIYAKPELEIYADDVKCKHGATVGQLDQDALFYLRARGIADAEAKEMLLTGFADEVLQRVPATIDIGGAR